MIVILVLYILFSLSAKFLLGCTVISRVAGRRSVNDGVTCFIVGAVLHLLGLLLLKSLHFSWATAVAVASVPGLLSIQELGGLFPKAKSLLNWDYLLWLAVVAASGTTTAATDSGVSSLWENNSSDLAFHIGIISSFVLGDNFPPQYTIFPGESLSYSFLINLWSAEWWWIDPVYSRLSVVFWAQWFVLWALVYRLLTPSRIAPWLLLFGGGSVFNFFYTSKELIAKNLPWSVFISTIWIPQRSAVFGLVVLLAALRLYFVDDENRSGNAHARHLLSGLLLGLSVLVHAHLVATCALFILLLQGIKCGRLWRCETGKFELSKLKSFLPDLASAALTLPFLIGKEGMVEPMAGWITGDMVNNSAITRLCAAFTMWLKSIPHIFALGILISGEQKFRTEVLVIAGMFLTGNFIKLAVWPWDQIKFFLGLYVILVFFLSRTRLHLRFLTGVLLILLVVPAIWVSVQELASGEEHTIYSPSHIEAALKLDNLLPKRAIVVAAPSAFSIVTLAGRFLYKGYDGTLWSHGIKKASIASRAFFETNLSTVGTCKYQDKPLSICPDFLLWSSEEQEFWQMSNPPEEWQETELSWLYRRLDGTLVK